MELHPKAKEKSLILIDYLYEWFRQPVGFENTAWLSQIAHGLSIKIGTEHWRRSMPRTMGALHWYLADNWFTINYGGIDLHGRWKALHYMSKRFFAPILVSGAVDTRNKRCEIFVNNDTRESRQYDLRWKVTSAAGQSLAEGAKPIRARPGAAMRVETLKLKTLIEAHGARDVLVWLELYDGDVRVSENFVHFERPKAMDLIDPCIEASVGKARNGEFHVTLKAKHPALWTWLELTDCDARFSENFVCLCPDAPVTVAASPEDTLSLAQFKKQLQVRSLYDTFNCG
jgi:beta-mannosidase